MTFSGAGQRFNAHHPAMAAKLAEIDSIIERTLTAVETHPLGNRTLVVVLGDHGMTDSGNHGGVSPEVLF